VYGYHYALNDLNCSATQDVLVSALFCVATQPRLVGPLGCAETPVTIYQSNLRNNPKTAEISFAPLKKPEITHEALFYSFFKAA
jgi:hypothetical protein